MLIAEKQTLLPRNRLSGDTTGIVANWRGGPFCASNSQKWAGIGQPIYLQSFKWSIFAKMDHFLGHLVFRCAIYFLKMRKCREIHISNVFTIV